MYERGLYNGDIRDKGVHNYDALSKEALLLQHQILCAYELVVSSYTAKVKQACACLHQLHAQTMIVLELYSPMVT